MRSAKEVVAMGDRVQRFAKVHLGYDINEACLFAHRAILRAIAKENAGEPMQAGKPPPPDARPR